MGVTGTVWGYNLCSYCETNPISYTDSNGKCLKAIWKKIKKFVNKAIYAANNAARAIGIDTASYGAFVLQMKKDKKGIYFMGMEGRLYKFRCWC